MSIKRNLISLAESTLNVRIVRPNRAASVVALQFEELHLKRVFERFDVDCVFDIGAHTGEYAEKLRHSVGYRGQVLSYEPIPKLVAKLREKAKRDPKWHVNEIALDNTAGRKAFNIMANDQFSSLLVPTESDVNVLKALNKIEQRIEVESRTLTQEFENWSPRIKFRHPFLKMDTQGNDLAVVQGGEDVLRNFVGIQTEMGIKKLYDGAPDFIEAIKYFRSIGFELSALVPNNEGHFPQLIEIDAILIRDDLITENSPRSSKVHEDSEWSQHFGAISGHPDPGT